MFLLIAHQLGHKVNATVVTTVTPTRMRFLRTGILATAFVLTGCQPGAEQVPWEGIAAVAAVAVLLLRVGEYAAGVTAAQVARRARRRDLLYHEHKWYEKPYLIDGDEALFKCRVPGCQAKKRERYREPA